MSSKVKIFVSYSHQDTDLLDSLLNFLEGLEKENVQFWTDRNIRIGEQWDAAIKASLQEAAIALVLVSQYFLDSDYCRNVEIERLLSQKKFLFPVILSPCEWRRYDWLSSRHSLPGGDKTIREHYTDPGQRERLLLKIREQLRERIELLGKEQVTPSRPSPATYSGSSKVEFCRRLGPDWFYLADLLEIPPYDQARFGRGDEVRGVWEWLENRARLGELPKALVAIGRLDLAELLKP